MKPFTTPDADISAISMMAEGLLIEAPETLDELTIQLTPTLQGVFRKEAVPTLGTAKGRANFEWYEARPGTTEDQGQSASGQGVLWRRREAIEAQRTFDEIALDRERWREQKHREAG